MPILLIAGTAPNPGHVRAWILGYSKGSGVSAPRKTAVQLRPVACLRERALRLRGRAEAELDAARDAKLINGAVNDLSLITGQKPEIRRARMARSMCASLKAASA